MLKKSISYWSFDGGLDGSKSVAEAIKETKNAGYDAIELTLGDAGDITMESTQADMEKIRKTADEVGLKIAAVATGLFWGCSLTANDPAVRDQAKKNAVKEIEIASWLGADAVLVIPGAVDVFFLPDAEIIPYEVCYQRAQEAIKELVSVAEKHGVKIGCENVWNKFLLSPLEMRDFVDSIGSDFVGVYFDVGNAVLTGFPEDWINILGKRIVRVHLKDFKSAGFDGSVGAVDGFCDLTEGDINWPNVVAALKNAGYDSYLTAEMIPPTSNITRENVIQRASDAISKIIQM